jgi:hypothetical protein
VEPPEVPGDDPGPGGGGTDPTTTLPPTYTPGYIGYSNPRYRLNMVVNEKVSVIDLINEAINPTARMFISQGWNGQIQLHNKRPVTWGLALDDFSGTNIPLDDIRNWVTDRSGLLLIDPYTENSEIREAVDANYSVAQNAVPLTATANMTVVGFSGCDGNNTPATATITVNDINEDVASSITLDGITIGYTAVSADSEEGIAGFLAATINAHPKLKRRFVATYSGAVVTIKGTFGTLVTDEALGMPHPAPLANPTTAPSVSLGSGGSLQAGEYKLAYSYVNSRGQTLLSPVTSITVTAGQKINVFGLSLPSDTLAVNWYLTPAPGSVRIRLHSTNDGTAFSITSSPKLTNTLQPEVNRTGAEVMRVRMSFTDRAEPRTGLNRSNVLRATSTWSSTGTKKKSINSIVLKYRDSDDDWRLVELHFNDDANIEKVKKTEPYEVNGQGIHNTYQALRIGSSLLAESRDADFFFDWGCKARKAALLEEGDVVAYTDDSYGVVNFPVMIEEINYSGGTGPPKITFHARKFSNSLYDDSIAERVTPVFREFTVTTEGDGMTYLGEQMTYLGDDMTYSG